MRRMAEAGVFVDRQAPDVWGFIAEVAAGLNRARPESRVGRLEPEKLRARRDAWTK
jgi:hypothetical protein